MKKDKSPHRKHIFICCNEKKDGSGCGVLGGNELRQKLKQLALEKGLFDVRVNKSGCLDCCNDGITAVLYPEGHLYTKLSVGDAEKLLKEIE